MAFKFDLYFEQLQSDFPCIPRAYVCLRSWSKDESGRILLTPDCVDFTEFNAQIDLLQKDLEEVRKLARRNFRKADQKRATAKERMRKGYRDQMKT